MKSFLLALFTLFVGLSLAVPDAEAKRLGGGRNSGMQRDNGSFMKRDAAPQAPARPQPGAAPQTPQKRSWLGPLAGLAAGLGLAALASHFGFGEGLANFLMIALLAMAAIFLVRWFMRRNQPAPQPMQYAGAGPANTDYPTPQAMPGSVSDSFAQPAAPALPAGFDVEGFTRQAKVNFLRMQAANDAGNHSWNRPSEFRKARLERNACGARFKVSLPSLSSGACTANHRIFLPQPLAVVKPLSTPSVPAGYPGQSGPARNGLGRVGLQDTTRPSTGCRSANVAIRSGIQPEP